jgi:hypothetical protein
MSVSVFATFRSEIMELVIKPKFQLLAAQRNFKSQRDFFDKFREQWETNTSDATLKKWMKELGYELIECTEMIITGGPPPPGRPQPQPLNEADGFDNETTIDLKGFDFSIGGIVDDPRTSGG